MGPGQRSVANWVNYGGDKVWNAPQSDWGWPPATELDGTREQVRILGNKVFVKSPISSTFGVYVERVICLDATEPVAYIENSLISTRDQQKDLAVWEITQTNDPEVIQIPFEASRQFPSGYVAYDGTKDLLANARREGNVVNFYRNHSIAYKFGSATKAGWLAVQRKGTRLTVSAPLDSKGTYVDSGKAQQWYGNPDPDKYVELELTSPTYRLKKGDSAKLKVMLRLDHQAK